MNDERKCEKCGWLHGFHDPVAHMSAVTPSVAPLPWTILGPDGLPYDHWDKQYIPSEDVKKAWKAHATSGFPTMTEAAIQWQDSHGGVEKMKHLLHELSALPPFAHQNSMHLATHVEARFADGTTHIWRVPREIGNRFQAALLRAYDGTLT